MSNASPVRSFARMYVCKNVSMYVCVCVCVHVCILSCLIRKSNKYASTLSSNQIKKQTKKSWIGIWKKYISNKYKFMWREAMLSYIQAYIRWMINHSINSRLTFNIPSTRKSITQTYAYILKRTHTNIYIHVLIFLWFHSNKCWKTYVCR